jgi:hypothetical protein
VTGYLPDIPVALFEFVAQVMQAEEAWASGERGLFLAYICVPCMPCDVLPPRVSRVAVTEQRIPSVSTRQARVFFY